MKLPKLTLDYTESLKTLVEDDQLLTDIESPQNVNPQRAAMSLWTWGSNRNYVKSILLIYFLMHFT